MKKENQLLARIGKALGSGVNASDVVESEAYLSLQAEFDSYKETAEQLAQALQAENAEMKATLAQAQEQLTALQQFAAEAEAAKAEAARQAEELRVSVRKEKLEAAIGTVKAAALMEATKDMDDTAFGAILAAVETSLEAESKSAMFKEEGVTGGDIDPAKMPQAESKEMKILREKYKNAGA